MTVHSERSRVRVRDDYLPPSFTITDLELVVTIDPDLTKVTASSRIKRRDKRATQLFLDGSHLHLEQLQIGGCETCHYEVTETGLWIHDIPPGIELFSLQVVTHIIPKTNASLEGFYQSGELLCTQCEAEGFRKITYFLDRPDVSTRIRTRLVANRKQYPVLLCNGNRIDSGLLAGEQHWVLWEDPFPKPVYLFAMVAGALECVADQFTTQSGRQVAIEFYVEPGKGSRTAWAIDCLKRAMRWDEQRFSLEYDLSLYMIVAVSHFNSGAMENKGLNIFNEKYVLVDPFTATDTDYRNVESVIAHEYFHNWTGNRVTCRDWFQLTLKEGLTVFRDQEFSSDASSRTVNRLKQVRLIRTRQFLEDASPIAHPIRPDRVLEMRNFYTVTVYEKGAEVVRMLHTIVGEALFKSGLLHYLHQHDGEGATCDDFVAAMEAVSNRDLVQFRRWYSQSGTPEISVTSHYDAVSQGYLIQLTQHLPLMKRQPTEAALSIPVRYALYNEAGHRLKAHLSSHPVLSEGVLLLTKASESFLFEGVLARPILSIFDDFSAPVRVHYKAEQSEWFHLVQYAEDPVSRWNALEHLIHESISINIPLYQAKKPLQLPKWLQKSYAYLLSCCQPVEMTGIAFLLTFPSETELSEPYKLIDPDAIHSIRTYLIQALGCSLRDLWEARYQWCEAQIDRSAFVFNKTTEGMRALQGTAIFYLMQSNYFDRDELIVDYYEKANTLTEKLAVLEALNHTMRPVRRFLLDQFAGACGDETLLVDKWFQLEASYPNLQTLERLHDLLQSSPFSLKRPNAVHALIGTFVTHNPYVFHAASGEGYRILVDQLRCLDASNPQLASRLVDPLLGFKRYDPNRQAKMRSTLEELYALPNLSADLLEKLSQSL